MIGSNGAPIPEANKVPVSISQEFDSFIIVKPHHLTENVHWGDAIHSKPDHSIRIYYQNIHGITSDNTLDKWEQIVLSMHQRHIDVCCFAEKNIKWT